MESSVIVLFYNKASLIVRLVTKVKMNMRKTRRNGLGVVLIWVVLIVEVHKCCA